MNATFTRGLPVHQGSSRILCQRSAPATAPASMLGGACMRTQRCVQRAMRILRIRHSSPLPILTRDMVRTHVSTTLCKSEFRFEASIVC